MPAYQLPINVALYVFLALKNFLLALGGGLGLSLVGQHDGVNHQGGLRSHKLLSLRAVHVPGSLNLGADMLSRNNVAPGEWTLHPQTDLKI